MSYSGLLFNFCDVGVDGVVYNVLSDFLSGRVQRDIVDGVRSEDVRVIYGVPQNIELDPLLLLLCTSDLSMILENTLVGYAVDSTLLVEVL